MSKINLAIFASGSGTNAENIANYFSDHNSIKVDRIFSNKKDAYVHERAKILQIKSSAFSREEFNSSLFVEKMQNIDFIVLAGFLWLIPRYLIEAFPNKIINIHPALLPKYGGKGMYGNYVHEAVIAAREKESGISIHLVNEQYDEGELLYQAKCTVERRDTPKSLAQKIQKLEYAHFPRVIEEFISRPANF